MLAIKLFKSQEGLVSASEKVEVDFYELAISILIKFVHVLEGVAVIIAGIFVVRYFKGHFAKVEIKHEQQKTALNLLEKITSGFIIIISITLGLKIIGLDLTLIVSVLTLGVSFGMRDVIKNYVAGLLILFKSPFDIGDVVKIRTFTGIVEKIEFQSITIKTFDHKEITIHNSDLLTQPIINFSKNQQRRLEILVSVGYGSDLHRALKIFDRILSNNPVVLKEPHCSIVFQSFGENDIKVLVRFWIQRPCNALRIRSAIALQIQEAFDEEKIFAPYAREAGLDGTYSMTQARKERLQVFYNQPILADIVNATAAQIAAASQPEDYVDADEPE